MGIYVEMEGEIDIMYITRVVYLDVTSTYKPQLEFYCQVAAGGNFYNILSKIGRASCRERVFYSV